MADARRDAWLLAGAMAALLLSPPVPAADPPPGEAPPAQERAKQKEAPPPSEAPAPPADEKGEDAAPPSLDDLLGLPEDETDRRAEEAARRDAREALDRELAEKRITDAMELALQKMGLSADLLERKLDAGLGTQRVQEEILAKLDELIDQARNLQSMNRKGMQGDGKRSGGQQQPPQPGQRPQQAEGDRQRPPQSTDSTANDPPPPQEGDLNRIIDETRTEWGHLPPRVREMIRQWGQGKPSRLYQDLTREYYKRLAEDE